MATLRYREVMFEDVKEGDRVYSWVDGWGTVTDVFSQIDVRFDDETIGYKRFYLDGRLRLSDKNPTLFWDIPTFTLPKKPFNLKEEYKKLKRKKFEVNGDNMTIFYNTVMNNWYFNCLEVGYSFGTLLYSSENLEEFIEMLNKNQVGPIQLEKVIKEVESERV